MNSTPDTQPTPKIKKPARAKKPPAPAKPTDILTTQQASRIAEAKGC